jgi:hypothetical protein
LIFEYFIKLTGIGISSLIAFLPLQLEVKNDTLTVQTALTRPVTEDVFALTEQGFPFTIEFYASIIVNSSSVKRVSRQKQLTFKDPHFYIDSIPCFKDSIQGVMGQLRAVFSRVAMAEGDRLSVYVKAEIASHRDFQQSTGLKTAVLWNYYIPHLKSDYIMHQNTLVKQK